MNKFNKDFFHNILLKNPCENVNVLFTNTFGEQVFQDRLTQRIYKNILNLILSPMQTFHSQGKKRVSKIF